MNVDAEVQPLATTLDLASAARLDDGALTTLGAVQAARVRAGLARLAAAGDGDPADLRALDPSPRWKACALGAISAYGRPDARPLPPGAPAEAHAGELWRIVARDGWGWADERVVRVSGDDGSPVRRLFRTFHRNTTGPTLCPSFSARA